MPTDPEHNGYTPPSEAENKRGDESERRVARILMGNHPIDGKAYFPLIYDTRISPKDSNLNHLGIDIVAMTASPFDKAFDIEGEMYFQTKSSPTGINTALHAPFHERSVHNGKYIILVNGATEYHRDKNTIVKIADIEVARAIAWGMAQSILIEREFTREKVLAFIKATSHRKIHEYFDNKSKNNDGLFQWSTTPFDSHKSGYVVEYRVFP